MRVPHTTKLDPREQRLIQHPVGNGVPCVYAHTPSASAPFPPPQVGVARAPRVVPVQGAGRAVSCGSCPSAFPAPVCAPSS